MGYRIFLKGKKPVVVDSLAQAQKIVNVPVPSKDKSDKDDIVFDPLPNIGKNKVEEFQGHLNAPVHIPIPENTDLQPPIVDETDETVTEVTVTEDDFLQTAMESVNIVRVTGNATPPAKSVFKAPKK